MTVSIVLANDTERARAKRDQLAALLLRYDARRWQWTDVVRIKQGVVPHSHPVLTLNTLHLRDDAQLLATYLHEQLNWFSTQHQEATERAIEELRRMYPRVPVGLPEGAKSEFSSYLHLVVCYLEYAALSELLGPDEARRVVESWTFYTWIHATVLRDVDAISDIVVRHGLLP